MHKRLIAAGIVAYAGPFLAGTMLMAQVPTQGVRGNGAPGDESNLTLPASTGAPGDSSTPAAERQRSITTAAARIQDALDALDKIRRQYQDSGNKQAAANVLGAIANSHNALHQQQRSIEDLKSALTIWRELGNRQGEALTLAHMGDVYRAWGFPEQANRAYREALAIYPMTDKSGHAATLNNVGLTYFSLHEKKRCLEALEEALAAYRALGDRHGEALALSNLGAAYNFLSNDPQKALDMFQEAVTKLELLDDRGSEANALDNMGVVWLNLHKPEMASLSFHHAIALYERIGDAQGAAAVRKHMEVLGESESIALGH